jgi:hypothetical protein
LGGLSDLANRFIDASIAWRDRQTQEKLAAAQKLAEESEARRKAEETARIEAEKRGTEQRKANKKLRFWLLLAVAFGLIAGFLGISSLISNQEAQLKAQGANIKVKLALSNEIGNLLESIQLTGDNQSFNRRWFKSKTKLLPEVQSVLYQAVADTKEIYTFNGHQDVVNSVAISADGRYIVSGSEDNTVKLWRGTVWQDWLAVGCDGVRLHPVLVSTQTNINIIPKAAKTCWEYGNWNDSEKAEFLVKQGLALAAEKADLDKATDKFEEAEQLDSAVDLEKLTTEAKQLAANTVKQDSN